jgi:hypothetical protein
MFWKEFFISQIDSRFWNHILKESVISYKYTNFPIDKQEFLEKLYDSIFTWEYYPSKMENYLTIPKNIECVPRLNPIFSISDYVIYYYCIKQIQSELVQGKILNTFWAFRLDSDFRRLELTSLPYELDYMPIASFNRFGWKKEWSDFLNLTNQLLTNYENPIIIEFDIANFYDRINISLLENKVRMVAKNDKIFEVNLLFHFLKNRNRKNLLYKEASVWIPMDEVWECSRILANFFLQGFDSEFLELCKESNVSFIRYADDMLIITGENNEHILKNLIFKAWILLDKIWLSINSSKTKKYKHNEYLTYRWVNIFDLLKDTEDISSVEKAIELYRIQSSGWQKFRKDSVIKKLLKIKCWNQLDIHMQNFLLAEALSKEIFFFLDIHYIKTIYELYDDNGKIKFTEYLNRIVYETPFNQILFWYRRYICDKNELSIPWVIIENLIKEKNWDLI